jgi:nucleotide-binding universal stress UspA family protein
VTITADAVYPSIVVGTDGSPTAAETVTRAAGLAAALGATLHLVSAYRDPVIAVAPHGVPIDLGDWKLEL